MKAWRWLLSIALVCATVSVASAESPWIAEKGQVLVSSVFNFDNFDDFWMADRKADFGDGPAHQYTTSLGVEAGVYDNLSLDAMLGWSWVQSGEYRDEGLDDIRYGASYRFINEFQSDQVWMPTVTGRVGGIAQGTYHAFGATEAGDGASGVEASLLYGKLFGTSGFGLSGSVKGQWLTEGTPSRFIHYLGAFQTLFDRVTLSAGYRYQHSATGYDINGTGFSSNQFHETKEIYHNLELGTAYTDRAGRTYGLTFVRTLAGRNTRQKFDVIALVQIPFELGGKYGVTVGR